MTRPHRRPTAAERRRIAERFADEVLVNAVRECVGLRPIAGTAAIVGGDGAEVQFGKVNER